MQFDVKEPEVPKFLSNKWKNAIKLLVYIVKMLIYFLLAILTTISTIKNLKLNHKSEKFDDINIEQKDTLQP